MKRTSKILVILLMLSLLVGVFAICSSAAETHLFTITSEGTLNEAKYPQQDGFLLNGAGNKTDKAPASGSKVNKETFYEAWRRYIWSSDLPHGEITLTLNDDYTQIAGANADTSNGNWIQDSIGWGRTMSMIVDLNGKELTFQGSPYKKDSTTSYVPLIEMNYSYGFDETVYPDAIRTKLVFKNGTINLSDLKNSFIRFRNSPKMDIIFEDVTIVVDANCSGNFGLIEADSWNSQNLDDINIIFKNSTVDASAVTNADLAIVKLERGNHVDLKLENSTFKIGAGRGIQDGKLGGASHELRNSTVEIINSTLDSSYGTGYAMFSASAGSTEQYDVNSAPPVITLTNAVIKGKVRAGRASYVLCGGYYDCTFEGSQTNGYSSTTLAKLENPDSAVAFSAYPTFKAGTNPAGIGQLKMANASDGSFKETVRGVSWIPTADSVTVTFTIDGIPVWQESANPGSAIELSNLTLYDRIYKITGVNISAVAGDKDSTVAIADIPAESRTLNIENMSYNLSLLNDMSINLAIPAEYVREGLIESVALVVGETSTPLDGKLMTVGEESYYVVTYSGINVARAGEIVSFKITDGTYGVEKTVDVSAIGYAKELLLSAESMVEAELARAILEYVLDAMRYFDGDAGAIADIESALSSATAPEEKTSFGESIDTGALGETALFGASIDFSGTTPAFVITLDDGAPETVVRISYTNYKNEPVRRTFVLNQNNPSARIERMKVCDFANTLTIKVGTSEYTYNLVTFLNGFVNSGETEDEKAESKAFANAIWNYVQAVTEYRRFANEYVKYSDFGADVTGEDDAFLAIKAAHVYANSRKIKVVADEGATYYIGVHCEEIKVMTDTDWKDARFIIDDSGLDNATSKYYIFHVAASVERYLIDLTKVSVDGSKFRPGSTNVGLTFDSNVFLDIRNDNKQVYKRTGGEYHSMQELILVDKNGNVDSDTPILFDYGELTKIKVCYVDDAPITVEGGVFVNIANRIPSAGYSSVYRGIKVERSNTTVKGIQHYVIDEPTAEGSSMPYYGFYYVENANNVLIKDCIMSGHKVYRNTVNGSPNGTYDTVIEHSNEVRYENCVQKKLSGVNMSYSKRTELLANAVPVNQSIIDSSLWGVFASNFSKNITLDSCKFSRFDAHCGVHNVTIRDCEIGYQTLNMVGSGTAQIIRTTVHGGSLISLRGDYGATWDGVIEIEDCTLITSADATVAPVISACWTNHDFGYECHLPDVYVNGFTVYKGMTIVPDESLPKCLFYAVDMFYKNEGEPVTNRFEAGPNNNNPYFLPDILEVDNVELDYWFYEETGYGFTQEERALIDGVTKVLDGVEVD